MTESSAGDIAWNAFAAHFDRDYLVQTMSQLAQVPTHVPLGYETLMAPDDPKLVHYVQNVLRPELVRLGYYHLVDAPLNNLVIPLGSGETDPVLLIQNYTPTQHHNLMDDPFSGRVASARDYGRDEPAVFGQGVSQNKAHQAVMLALLKLLRESDLRLRARLYWAINNEGRSSHACSEAIIGVLDDKPTFGILQINTGAIVWLGNRGRVDVNIHVQGKAAHSSSPEAGLSAIEGANQVLNRLKTLTWADRHPLLGGRQAIAYKIRYEPVAPHTLPSDAYIAVDRRLLPDDDPDQAAQEIREVVGDLSPFQVTVERGVCMVPALVDADLPGVQALLAAHRAVHGREAETVYGQGAFDAGGLCAQGVPTVMYGAAGGEGLLGVDFVTIADAEAEAQVLLQTICRMLL